MKLVMLFVELFNQIFRDFTIFIFSWFHLRLWLKPVVVLVFLLSSVILLVNSRCSSLMLNHHLINHLIISLTLTLLQCYFNHMYSEQSRFNFGDFAVHSWLTMLLGNAPLIYIYLCPMYKWIVFTYPRILTSSK